MKTIPLAIVGNGAAAAEAIRALRDKGYTGEVHLFADNEHGPYNPMLGTYVVSGAVPEERAFPFGEGRSFYDEHQVTAHLQCAVTSLDPETQSIGTTDGALYEYERCLVATGARPSLPPVTGLREAVASPEAPVFTIQTFEDAVRLKRALDELRSRTQKVRAAVVGASFAGVKVADALQRSGLEVVLIEREPSILPLSAHPLCAHQLEDHLLAEGYRLRLGAALASVEVRERRVHLGFGALPGVADPQRVDATGCEESETGEDVDLVVVCTGSRPALSFLKAGSVNMGVGIIVDEHMRSNVPTLYAAGDVAQGRNLLSGRHEIIGLWSSARYQGRAAGRSLAGTGPGYLGNVPSNITHVGHRLFASIGCVRNYDEMYVCSECDDYQLRVWQDGRLAGVNLIDHCLAAGAVKQGILRAVSGAVAQMQATWASFGG